MTRIRLHYATVKSEQGKFRVYQQGEVVDFPFAEAMHMLERNKATLVDEPTQPDDDEPPYSPYRTASKAGEGISPDVSTAPAKRGRKKRTE